MCIGHVLQLEMGGLGIVLNDVDPFNAKQYEREKQDIDELYSEK